MKKQKGFSFMEVMTAMFVVSVGLVTVISLFAKGLINSAIDRDRIVAAGLAQEGLEIVKNIRDNKLAIPGNADGFGVFPARNDCRVNYDTTVLDNSVCFANANNPETHFSLALSGGNYTFTSGVQKFSRYVNIDFHSSGVGSPYANVTSIVYWKSDYATDIKGVDKPLTAAGALQLANCTIGNKCVYAQMRLEGWKP
jgi:prepilin-type N-terminal cleavage/methylation domain-containing protein